MKTAITRYACSCEQCGHVWATRGDVLPAVCPKCKSREWDRDIVSVDTDVVIEQPSKHPLPEVIDVDADGELIYTKDYEGA